MTSPQSCSGRMQWLDMDLGRFTDVMVQTDGDEMQIFSTDEKVFTRHACQPFLFADAVAFYDGLASLVREKVKGSGSGGGRHFYFGFLVQKTPASASAAAQQQASTPPSSSLTKPRPPRLSYGGAAPPAASSSSSSTASLASSVSSASHLPPRRRSAAPPAPERQRAAAAAAAAAPSPADGEPQALHVLRVVGSLQHKMWADVLRRGAAAHGVPHGVLCEDAEKLACAKLAVWWHSTVRRCCRAELLLLRKGVSPVAAGAGGRGPVGVVRRVSSAAATGGKKRAAACVDARTRSSSPPPPEGQAATAARAARRAPMFSQINACHHLPSAMNAAGRGGAKAAPAAAAAAAAAPKVAEEEEAEEAAPTPAAAAAAAVAGEAQQPAEAAVETLNGSVEFSQCPHDAVAEAEAATDASAAAAKAAAAAAAETAPLPTVEAPHEALTHAASHGRHPHPHPHTAALGPLRSATAPTTPLGGANHTLPSQPEATAAKAAAAAETEEDGLFTPMSGSPSGSPRTLPAAAGAAAAAAADDEEAAEGDEGAGDVAALRAEVRRLQEALRTQRAEHERLAAEKDREIAELRAASQRENQRGKIEAYVEGKLTAARQASLESLDMQLGALMEEADALFGGEDGEEEATCEEEDEEDEEDESYFYAPATVAAAEAMMQARSSNNNNHAASSADVLKGPAAAGRTASGHDIYELAGALGAAAEADGGISGGLGPFKEGVEVRVVD